MTEREKGMVLQSVCSKVRFCVAGDRFIVTIRDGSLHSDKTIDVDIEEMFKLEEWLRLMHAYVDAHNAVHSYEESKGGDFLIEPPSYARKRYDGSVYQVRKG